MSTRFRSTTRELIAGVEEWTFDRPPALVANAHITGLGVARALDADDIPVIALDRTPDGVAPGSDAVDIAGPVTYPLDDLDSFQEDIEAIAAAADQELVAYGCMDEWVHALADTRPEGIRLPFAADRIAAVLDKTVLYDRCEELGIPYPETYRIEETGIDGNGPPVRTAEKAVDELGYPLVLKPARKREFEEAVGTNVIEVEDHETYREIVARAAEDGIRLMAQKRVNVTIGEDRSVVSYVPPEGDPVAIVGNARRYPAGYGTSCVVERVEDLELRERAGSILATADYYGISEAEFVLDQAREEYVLLDVNTRPWKWIGLPVAAGVNLPMAAYADAIGDDGSAYSTDTPRNLRWVYLADYLQRLADGGTDVLSREEWLALLRGEVGGEAGVVTGVYDPDDPEPTYQLVRTELGNRDYYCSC